MTLQRRTALKLLAGSAVACATLPASAAGRKAMAAGVRAEASDPLLAIRFDSALRSQVLMQGRALTGFDDSETLVLAKGVAPSGFVFQSEKVEPIQHPRHGPGTRHVIQARNGTGIEKTVEVTLHGRFPGMAILRTIWRNGGSKPLELSGWRNAAHEMSDAPGGFWSFSGATHEDRRDWVQPLKAGFAQDNNLGMSASDYGGGTPVANIWRRDAGLAVGHVFIQPRQLQMPVRKTNKGASIAISSGEARTLQPGESFSTDDTFLCVHEGDHFLPLTRYREYMRDDGIAAPATVSTANAPIWCAWGYERNFNTEQIVATLPKAKSLGLEWAVLDDGWQTNEGDWKIDRKKFPRGEDDMRAFVNAIKDAGMRPRLWIAPLAVDPGSDLLHEHSDMLLTDQYGAPQLVSWWNSLTLCPAYQPTVDYFVKLTKTIIGDWGYEGLKLDGQHLNAVAPCFNPAHKHASPQESVQKLDDFWMAIHTAAHEANPNAVVELCPCGTAFAFHNLPATDQYPSSDPLSSWQVRSKGKTAKALMGRGSSFAGDHVELSDGGRDFASSYGIGAVLSTKFTWPKDTDKPIDKLPPGGFVLTAEKEAWWRKWIALYNREKLPDGDYLGHLYDIGFDKPEAHAIAKGDVMHYAFYAKSWTGPIALRGLKAKRYRLTDAFSGKDLGEVDSRNARINTSFNDFLVVQATPIGDTA